MASHIEPDISHPEGLIAHSFYGCFRLHLFYYNMTAKGDGSVFQKNVSLFSLVLVILIALIVFYPTPQVLARALRAAGGSFSESFDSFDSFLWHKANGWTNGGVFNCGWREDHVLFSGGVMTLRLDDMPCPVGCNDKPYASGEYRSNALYPYGTFSVRLKAAQADGIVTSFFLYTDHWDDQPHDEIDIEILGKDTTRMQVNYWTSGVGGHEVMIDLGFDAAADFHTYTIEWLPDSITWWVDGVPVHTEDGSRGPLPSHPTRIMMNLWPGTGVDAWLNPFVYSGPLTAQYDWVSYRPRHEVFLPLVVR
jgi:beta-glucanase (GH16 family)